MLREGRGDVYTLKFSYYQGQIVSSKGIASKDINSPSVTDDTSIYNYKPSATEDIESVAEDEFQEIPSYQVSLRIKIFVFSVEPSLYIFYDTWFIFVFRGTSYIKF